MKKLLLRVLFLFVFAILFIYLIKERDDNVIRLLVVIPTHKHNASVRAAHRFAWINKIKNKVLQGQNGTMYRINVIFVVGNNTRVNIEKEKAIYDDVEVVNHPESIDLRGAPGPLLKTFLMFERALTMDASYIISMDGDAIVDWERLLLVPDYIPTRRNDLTYFGEPLSLHWTPSLVPTIIRSLRNKVAEEMYSPSLQRAIIEHKRAYDAEIRQGKRKPGSFGLEVCATGHFYGFNKALLKEIISSERIRRHAFDHPDEPDDLVFCGYVSQVVADWSSLRLRVDRTTNLIRHGKEWKNPKTIERAYFDYN